MIFVSDQLKFSCNHRRNLRLTWSQACGVLCLCSDYDYRLHFAVYCIMYLLSTAFIIYNWYEPESQHLEQTGSIPWSLRNNLITTNSTVILRAISYCSSHWRSNWERRDKEGFNTDWYRCKLCIIVFLCNHCTVNTDNCSTFRVSLWYHTQ